MYPRTFVCPKSAASLCPRKDCSRSSAGVLDPKGGPWQGPPADHVPLHAEEATTPVWHAGEIVHGVL
eukprot:4996080-Pyramimonas_sp.AAC.1